MSSDHVERRLAAILAADVAGSCRLIGIDEEGTLARLKALRRTIFDPKIAEHHGRVVKNTGDGAIAEFASVVDAVRCADEIQRGTAEQNIDVPQDKQIELRIGIHVGDIIIEENDVFGDAVNIAVRLEGIAEPGGISISDDARRHISGKVDVTFEDLGSQSLKNIAEPMRVWRVPYGRAVPAVPNGWPVDETLALPNKPSIAVLPFTSTPGPRTFWRAEQAGRLKRNARGRDITTLTERCYRLYLVCSSDSLAARVSSLILRAKSHQPLSKWLGGAAPAVGAALIIVNVNPATAQQGEGPQRTEIAIPMSDQGIRAAGILTARVSPAQGRSDLSFPGTVIIPQHQIRVIATPAGGIVEALMVGQDEPVVAGQVVAQVRSPDLVEAQRLYLAAISDDALASDKLRRARLLFEGKAVPERDLRIAESEAAVNKAKLDERTQLLFLIGMDKTEFETLQSSRTIASALTLRSPVSGTVVTRHVGVGEQIKAAAPLFTLGILDPLHVNIQVPAHRLSTIDIGAHVSIPAYRVDGKIIRIGRTVDQATQSAIAVAEVRSGGGRLRPGLAVAARIVVEHPAPETANNSWTVPAVSVVRHRDQSWVFLRRPDGFRAIPVQVLNESVRNISIKADLVDSDEVATRGVLALLSELAEADKEN